MPHHLNLQSLTLCDYRCFEAIDIDFHPRLTVLVASNGAGKTAILDAIAVAFGPYIGAFDEAVGKHFAPSDIRRFQVRKTATHEMEYAAKGVRLEARGFIPGSLLVRLLDDDSPQTWHRALTSPRKAKTTIKDAKNLIDYGKRMQEAVRTEGSDVLLPLIAYYGTGRLWQQKKLTAGKKNERTSRTVGYTDCLDPASSYKSFVEWFRYWSFNAKDLQFSGQAHTPAFVELAGYIDSVKGAVNTCLAPSGWEGLEYSFMRDTLVAHHHQHGELPVELLSDGIRNMIGMVADIAFRATKLNGQLGAQAASQTPGIVLIDEVDMHLHPQWQQVVLQNLVQAFPAMQLIVTTHSPQVLTSVDASSIRILRQKWDSAEQEPFVPVAKVEFQTKGVSSADLLARIMGTDPIPNVPESAWISDYQSLIKQNLHQQAQGIELRQKIERHFGAKHPVLRDLDRLIRLQEFKQRLPSDLSRGKH